jgi:LysM repeat protein
VPANRINESAGSALTLLRYSLYICIIFLILTSFPDRVRAQSGSPQDLINEVNALRASSGLLPYTIDSSLMAQAQAHSDYQASIGQLTHTRADGSTPWSYGIQENIAGGTGLSIQAAVYSIWADSTHMNTMVGYESGWIGAGVAVVDGFVYYTLNVIQAGGGTSGNQSSAVNQQLQTSEPTIGELIVAVQTAVPQEDGSILHVVQPGQAPWSIAIAYGIKIADIASLNNLDPTNPVLYVGQELLIRPPLPVTSTPVIPDTPKVSPPVIKSTATNTPFMSITPTSMLSITPTPELSESGQKGIQFKIQYLGIGIVALCIAGLVFGIFTWFIRK